MICGFSANSHEDAFVIPSEVEESLGSSDTKISRDLSTSLEMTLEEEHEILR
jgi:hypothetical protein